MKTLKSLFVLTLSLIAASALAEGEETRLHDFTMRDIEGEEVELGAYRGKVVLVVNTASRCGFTRQYEDLVNLQEAYEERGVVVLGFPANNFGDQEPGSDEEIQEFCEVNFGVNFPLFSKISVKGEDQHALFAYLTAAENPDFTGEIGWNFEKFLVGGDGRLLRRFRSRVNPNEEEVREAVEAALLERE